MNFVVALAIGRHYNGVGYPPRGELSIVTRIDRDPFDLLNATEKEPEDATE